MKEKYNSLLLKLKSPLTIKIVVVIFSIITSFLYFGPTLNSQFDIIDDHYYVSSNITSEDATLWENFVTAPEITSFGNYPRFRIIYYLINNAELKIFGLNSVYFYLVNIFVFAFFLFSIFSVVYKYLGGHWATIFTLFVASQKYFAYIFTRLGTAEVWTILGLSMYSLAFSSLYDKSKLDSGGSNWKDLLLMFAGAIIMIGSKENFTIVGAFVFLLIFILKKRRKLTLPFIISSILILLFNAYQIVHISLTHAARGVDFNMNDVGFLDRLSRLISGAFSGSAQNLSLFIAVCLCSIFIFAYFFFQKNKLSLSSAVMNKMILRPLVAGGMIVFVYIFNLYVYSGVLNPLNRYAFPLILFIQILALFYVVWIIDLHKYLKIRININIKEFFYYSVLGFLLVLSINAVAYSRQMSFESLERTTSFQNDLRKIAEEVKVYSEYPIVFSTYVPSDHEPLRSVLRYLRYYGVSNTIMIKGHHDLSEDAPFVVKEVSRIIMHLEKNGGDEGYYNGGKESFSAYSLQSKAGCYNVDFSGITKDEKCTHVGKIWQNGEYKY